MPTLPAKFQPTLSGISGNQFVRRRRVQFGEGYVQRSVDSTNPLSVSLTVNFLVWGDADLNEFLAFFNDLGAGTLTLTLPNETTSHEYEVENVNVDYVDAMQRNCSIQIKRVY